MDSEKVPGTWAHELRRHFEAFSSGCWRAFNHAADAMNEANEGKVDRLKWREYVLWDMRQKHDKEMKDKKGEILDGVD